MRRSDCSRDEPHLVTVPWLPPNESPIQISYRPPRIDDDLSLAAYSRDVLIHCSFGRISVISASFGEVPEHDHGDSTLLSRVMNDPRPWAARRAEQIVFE